LFGELQGFEQELQNRGVTLELIFVNDGSGDKSLPELLKIKGARSATKVVSFTKNFGAVAASKAGFRRVTGDAFIVLAADLQDPISQVLEMVDLWLQGRKFVIAVRDGREDPLLSKLLSWLYYRIVRWLVIKGFPDEGFDLMLASKELLPYLNQQSRNVNPNLFCYALGFAPTVIRYKRVKRKHGKSRWTFRKKWNHFVNTITGFSVAPIRLVSFIGITTAIASFLYAIDIFVHALISNLPVQGFATLAVLVAFFSGLILTTLGVIGEYIWRIFETVNHQPESVVDEEWM
jgi:dolichol-phosphate mannosyltransferase